MEVELLVPLKKAVGVKGEIEETNCLSTAIGLGLGELRKSPIDLNLLPPSLRAKRRKSHIIMTFALIGLILFSSMGIIGSVIIKDRLELSGIKRELKTIKKKVVKVEKMELKYDEIGIQLSELNKLWDKDINVLDVIKN